MKVLNHLELFSGIGGFRKAIDLLCNDYGVASNCVGFSEKDKFALSTYRANFQTNGELEIGDIECFTDEVRSLTSIPKHSLLTAGFPCQAFSLMGRKKGFKDRRGNVFYRIIDILETSKPRVILLENVMNLVRHDEGKTFAAVLKALSTAGYETKWDIFNTKNFGLAQNRRRLFILGVLGRFPKDFEFTEEAVRDSFSSREKVGSLQRQTTVLDVLRTTVDKKYYLSEKIKPTILSNGTGGFKSKSEINQVIARPLTATMVKLHRACQDNYYSDGFLKAKDPVSYLNRHFSKEELTRQSIRRLTPCEALSLQGFDQSFCRNAKEVGVSDHQLYKQAGNAVSVNSVYSILHHVLVVNRLVDGLIAKD